MVKATRFETRPSIIDCRTLSFTRIFDNFPIYSRAFDNRVPTMKLPRVLTQPHTINRVCLGKRGLVPSIADPPFLGNVKRNYILRGASTMFRTQGTRSYRRVFALLRKRFAVTVDLRARQRESIWLTRVVVATIPCS